MIRSSGPLAYALMRVLFRVRDLIWPPAKALKRIGLATGQTFLDYGSGPGSYALAAARIVGPAGKVYAVDSNPQAVEHLRQAAGRANLSNVTPILADSPAVLPAGSADLALLHDVLHELSDPPGVLAGLAGALKADGLLVVSDHHMNESAIVSAVTAAAPFERAASFAGVYVFRRTGRG
jgi:precorrin-6B methylase 2